jgi:hypothetical protein
VKYVTVRRNLNEILTVYMNLSEFSDSLVNFSGF